jgi:hypothetical protein
MIISSAHRLKCSPRSESALTNSRTKSRSLVASILFAVGTEKSSSSAMKARSSGRVAPATAPDPSGHRFRRFRQSASRSASRRNIST